MTNQAIMDIPVDKWAADDCVLALWTPPTMVDACVDIGRAWGFTWCTKAPWLKQWASGRPKRGAGTWFMQTHEDFTLWTRGVPGVRKYGDVGVLALLLGEDRTLFAVPPKRHKAAKPYSVYDYLYRFPGPRLELFATEEREGWTSWGYDLGQRLNEHGVEPGTEPLDPQMPLFKGVTDDGNK